MEDFLQSPQQLQILFVSAPKFICCTLTVTPFLLQFRSMASVLEISLRVCIFWALLISQAVSLTCTSQKVTDNNVPYSMCLDLPTLNAYLHYSYHSSNTTLSVAFIASPAKQDGWIAWAINPTDMGMIGAQSLVAYKDKNGAVTAKTYNVSSYESVVESNLSFEVWDTRAEEATGTTMTIFGKIKVPADLAAKGKVNQVWQVGPKVTDGKLETHDYYEPNMRSKGELKLMTKSGQSPAPALYTPPQSNDTGGVSRIGIKNMGVYLGLFLFIGSFIVF